MPTLTWSGCKPHAPLATSVPCLLRFLLLLLQVEGSLPSPTSERRIIKEQLDAVHVSINQLPGAPASVGGAASGANAQPSMEVLLGDIASRLASIEGLYSGVTHKLDRVDHRVDDSERIIRDLQHFSAGTVQECARLVDYLGGRNTPTSRASASGAGRPRYMATPAMGPPPLPRTPLPALEYVPGQLTATVQQHASQIHKLIAGLDFLEGHIIRHDQAIEVAQKQMLVGGWVGVHTQDRVFDFACVGVVCNMHATTGRCCMAWHGARRCASGVRTSCNHSLGTCHAMQTLGSLREAVSGGTHSPSEASLRLNDMGETVSKVKKHMYVVEKQVDVTSRLAELTARLQALESGRGPVTPPDDQDALGAGWKVRDPFPPSRVALAWLHGPWCSHCMAKVCPSSHSGVRGGANCALPAVVTSATHSVLMCACVLFAP